MITVTEKAQAKVREYMEQASEPCRGLRVRAFKLGRHTFRYDLTLVLEGEARDDDVVQELGQLTVYLDPNSAEWLDGTKVDFVSEVTGTGFKIDNPQAKVTWDDAVSQRVQEVLDTRVGPALAAHGGWVELVKVDGDTAFVQLGGGCQGCGMASVTLNDGIRAAIVEGVPEIREVVDSTDHAAGNDPFYE